MAQPVGPEGQQLTMVASGSAGTGSKDHMLHAVPFPHVQTHGMKGGFFHTVKRHRNRIIFGLKLTIILTSSLWTWTVLTSSRSLLSEKELIQDAVTETWQIRTYDWGMRDDVARDALVKSQGGTDVQYRVKYGTRQFQMDTSVRNLKTIAEEYQWKELVAKTETIAGLVAQVTSADTALLASSNITSASSALLSSSSTLHDALSTASSSAANYIERIIREDLDDAVGRADHLLVLAVATIAILMALEVLSVRAHVRKLRRTGVKWGWVVVILVVSAAAGVDEAASRIEVVSELQHKLDHIDHQVLPAALDTMKWLYYDSVWSASIASFALSTQLGNTTAATISSAAATSAKEEWAKTFDTFLARKLVAEIPELKLYDPTVQQWVAYSAGVDGEVSGNASKGVEYFFSLPYQLNYSTYTAATSDINALLERNLAASLESSRDMVQALVHLSIVLTVSSVVILVFLDRIVRGLVVESRLAKALQMQGPVSGAAAPGKPRDNKSTDTLVLEGIYDEMLEQPLSAVRPSTPALELAPARHQYS